jgi:hypothetical protein
MSGYRVYSMIKTMQRENQKLSVDKLLWFKEAVNKESSSVENLLFST